MRADLCISIFFCNFAPDLEKSSKTLRIAYFELS